MDSPFQLMSRVERGFPHRPWHKLLCAAIVAAVGYAPLALFAFNEASKNYFPVNVPARTTPGGMHSGPFLINQHGYYLIEYQTAWSAGPDAFPPAAVEWTMRRQGKIAYRGATKAWGMAGTSRDEYQAEIGGFEVKTDDSTYYDLDVTLHTDLSKLAKANPRLVVEIHPIHLKGRGLFELLGAMAATLIALVYVLAALFQWAGDLLEARRWRTTK